VRSEIDSVSKGLLSEGQAHFLVAVIGVATKLSSANQRCPTRLKTPTLTAAEEKFVLCNVTGLPDPVFEVNCLVDVLAAPITLKMSSPNISQQSKGPKLPPLQPQASHLQLIVCSNLSTCCTISNKYFAHLLPQICS